MIRVFAGQLVRLLIVLAIVAVVTFVLTDLVPGDAAMQRLRENSTAEDYERFRAELGLDRPVLDRFLDWLGGLFRGDLGTSLVPPAQPVALIIARALPVTVELALTALLLALVLSLAMATAAAWRPGGIVDRLLDGVAYLLISIPGFLLAVLLLILLAILVPAFPIGQWADPFRHGLLDNLEHLFLPALALALAEVPIFYQLLRRDLGVTLREDFVLLARAKGMSRSHIVFGEALKPSMFSLLTLAGVSAGTLLGGSVIVERVFSLPGLGTVVVTAAQTSDYPIVQAGVLTIAAFYVVLNLVVDALYAVLDPRVRHATP